MTTLTLTRDGISINETKAAECGFKVSADDAPEVIELIRRGLSPVNFRPLCEWRRLAGDPANRGLNGWFFGTRWWSGVPAPLIAAAMRPGMGLVRERKSEIAKSVPLHELARCKSCGKEVPLPQITPATRRESRKGWFGTCLDCAGLKEAA